MVVIIVVLTLHVLALQGPLLLVLPPLLQHPLLRSDVKTVCRLLQVSKRMREALRSSDTSSLDVELSSAATAQAGFASWLPDHAGLVGTLDTGHYESEDVTVLAQCLHTFSLRQATTAAPALCLRSFTKHIPCASMLSALPAVSITRLELVFPDDDSNLHAPAFTSALASLRNLREFSMNNGDINAFKSCMEGLSQLPHLSEVSFESTYWNSLSSLPQQLQQLHLHSNEYDVLVDISHLSSLRSLFINAESLADNSVLPTGLTSLTVVSCVLSVQIITSLKSLQQLHLRCIEHKEGQALPANLAQLPKLEHVSLSYEACSQEGWEAAVAAAPTWQHLPQLKELSIYISSQKDLQQLSAEVVTVGQALAAATSLTRLIIHKLPAVGFCCYVKGLQQLADLAVHGGRFSRQDALQLKGLTQLTALILTTCPAVDDAVAISFVTSMRNLQRLALDACGMMSDGVLPLLEGLKGLRSVSLIACQGLQDESVPLLAQLTQLSHLGLEANDQLSYVSKACLKAALGDRVAV